MKTKLVTFRTLSLSLSFWLGLLFLTACQSAPATTLPAVEAAQVAQPTPTVEIIKSTEPIVLDWMSVKDPEDDYWKLVTELTYTSQFPGMVIRLDPVNKFPIYNIWFFYAKKSSAYDTALNTILTEFRNRDIQATFTIINVEYNAKDKEASLLRFAAAVQTAQTDQADLIFSAGSDATAVFYSQFAKLGIPIVTVNSKDPVLLGQLPDYENGSGTSMAFTSLNVPIDLQMNYLLQFKPELKNIAILYSSSNKSAIETQVNPIRKAAEALNIHVMDVIVENADTAQEELAQKVPLAVAEIQKSDAEMQNSIFLVTGDTTVFSQIPTINQNADKIAVLSVVPENVQAGDDSAALAIGVSFVSNAQLAAYYAAQILDGADPGSFKVGVVSPPDIAINFKRARAIGMKIPFTFFESASFVYDGIGQLVRKNGQAISSQGAPILSAVILPTQPAPTPGAGSPVGTSQPTAQPIVGGLKATETPAPAVSGITAENAAQIVNLDQLLSSGGNRLQLSPDGKLLAIFHPALDEINLFSLPGLEKQLKLKTGRLMALAFSPDSSLLAASGTDASIHLWRTADGGETTQLTGPARAASGLAFSPDGLTLAASSPSGLWLWAVAGGDPRNFSNLKSDTVFFAPDGQTLLVGNGNHISVVNASDGSVKSEIVAGRLVNASADGQWVAVGVPQGSVQIYSVQDGSRLFELKGSGSAEWMSGAFSPDGKIFAMSDHTGSNTYWIRIWNLANGKILQSVGDYRSAFTNLAFTPDGKSWISITEDELVDVWGIP